MDFLNTCFETTNEVRALAYYSHLLPGIVVLTLGFFSLKYAQNKNKAVLFFAFTLLLSFWLLGNLITWTSNDYYLVAGFWAPLDFINILFYLFILCFVIVDFSRSNRLPIYVLAFAILALIFPFLLTVTGLSVHEFDEPNCEMYGNDYLAMYKLVYEWIVIGGILLAGVITTYRNWGDWKMIRRAAITTTATVVFLAIFSSTEYISTLTDIYEINLYALFTLPIFVLILTYTIVEHGTFRFVIDSMWFVRLIFFIFILVGVSGYILIETRIEFLVTTASTVVTLGFGLLLLRSARREAEQRKQIEQLAKNLEKANERLKVLDKMKSEFVSIASHQLRSPLTAIRGYTSMLLEGSYGKLSKKATEAIERIQDSSRFMALSVEDYLNVSRIEAGNMKYEIADFNLKEVAEKVVDELRPAALKKGLLLIFRSDCDGSCSVHADIGKTRQVIMNLVDNAMKYTPKGGITVTAHDDVKKKKMYVTVKDTGVGMSKETQEEVFEKFVRAKNANQVNVTGTGLGLFVAKKMMDEMGGRIWGESEGEGKGSTFHIELPLLPGKYRG